MPQLTLGYAFDDDLVKNGQKRYTNTIFSSSTDMPATLTQPGADASPDGEQQLPNNGDGNGQRVERTEPRESVNAIIAGLKAAKATRTSIVAVEPERQDTVREVVKEKYLKMQSVKKALDALSKEVRSIYEQRAASGETVGADPLELSFIEQFLNDSIGLYLNTEQYHGAEHMLKMTKDILFLAEKGQLGLANVKRLVVTGVYHDIGNGEKPAAPGTDEFVAAEKFLQDLQVARKKGQEPLGGMSDEDAVQVVANILGTTFPDRFATADQLAHLEKVFLPNKQPTFDYVKEGVAILKKYLSSAEGVASEAIAGVTAESLAKAMGNKEAMTVKNADILASFDEQNIIRNGLTNYWEDAKRGMPFYGKMAADVDADGNYKDNEYGNGFAFFYTGGAHTFRHTESPDGPKNAYLSQTNKENGNRSILLAGENEAIQEDMAGYGREIEARREAYVKVSSKEHGTIMNLTQALIALNATAGENAINPIGLSIADLAIKLKELQVKPEADLRKAFDYCDNTLVAATNGAKFDPKTKDLTGGALEAAIAKKQQPLIERNKRVDTVVKRIQEEADVVDAYFGRFTQATDNSPEAAIAKRTIADLTGAEVDAIFTKKALPEHTPETAAA